MSVPHAVISVSGLAEGIRAASQVSAAGEASLLVEIDPGVILEAPVKVSIRLPGGACGSAVTVRAGHGSRVTVLEEATGDGEWTHEVQVHAGAEAVLEYAAVQTLEPSASAEVRQRAEAGAGATVSWRNVTLGGKQVTCETVSRAAGDNATCGIDWMSFAVGKEKYDLVCRNVFDAANGGGEILMKGVAQDTAHVTCRGMIEIGLGGGGTNTYLTQDVLMLDASAKVDAVPGLEIRTNDVKASHSAVVSRVTPEDLFYFGSRGIAKQEARRLFIEGFLGQIAERMPYAEDAVRTAVAAKMERAVTR